MADHEGGNALSEIGREEHQHNLKAKRVIQVSSSGAALDVTGISDGRKVVAAAGTRETLASSTACKYVIITAETDNTGTIVVGGSTVVAALATRRGTPLFAGDSVAFEVDDLNDINVDSTVSGDGVTYQYGT